MEQIKLNFNGEDVIATWININQQQESWAEYLLEDGTVIRAKMVMCKIFRVEGKFDDEGNPLYITKSQNVIVTHSPNNLRKQV